MITTPDYLDVFRIPLLRGRAFTDRDGKGADPVVIINQAMAKSSGRRAIPSPISLIIGRGLGADFEDVPRQIIGVVSDIRDNGLESNPGPTMYVPQGAAPGRFESAAHDSGVSGLGRADAKWSRTPSSSRLRKSWPTSAAGSRSRRFAPWTRSCPVPRPIKISIRSRSPSSPARRCLLAAIGIYGLMAYTVEQRTQEIGIRLALGAEYGDVRKMIIFQGMRLALIGVIIGVASSFALTKLIESLLYGVKARDPLVFIGVPVLLSLVALIAVWVPARRATRVSPMDALRCE